MPPCTLYDVLANAVAKWGKSNALAVKRPKPVRFYCWALIGGLGYITGCASFFYPFLKML